MIAERKFINLKLFKITMWSGLIIPGSGLNIHLYSNRAILHWKDKEVWIEIGRSVWA